MKPLTPAEIGVYITSQEADPEPSKKASKSNKDKISLEKFGFATEEEVVDYIKENGGTEQYFIVYTYEMIDGADILKILKCGEVGEI